MIGEQRKDIACIVLTDREGTEERMLEHLQPTADDLQSWLRWQTPYQVTVTPYVQLVDNVYRFSVDGPWSEIRSFLPDGHNYIGIYAPVSSACGRGRADSDVFSVNSPGARKCTRHEAGHAVFDAQHNVTGPLGEYQENYGGKTVMGQGWQLGAVNLDYAQLIPDRMKAWGTGHYFLVEPAVRDHAVLDGEHKVVYIEDAERWWAVSYFEGKIRIDTHRGMVKREPPWAGVHSHKSLRPGESWRDVHFVQTVGGRADVKIGNAATKSLPKVKAKPAEPIMPGHYYTESTHQGFQLFVRDGWAYIYWFTWNSQGAFWMVGDGPIQDRLAHIALYAVTDNGLEKVGGGLLWFTDPDNGVWHYWTELDDYQWPGRGRMEFTRLITPEEHPLDGAYETDEHEGLTVHKAKILDENKRLIDGVVAIWWDDNGWFYIEGPWRETLTIYEPKGGWPDTVTDSRIEVWGEAKINQNWFQYRRAGWSDWKGVELNRLLEAA